MATMAATIWKHGSRATDEPLTAEEETERVEALREAIGPQTGRSAMFCTDGCLHRFLRARNWNVKKAEKMLDDAIKWRQSYKPEEIKWEAVAKEAETGKVYRADFVDKSGRTVLVMRPANQNTSNHDGHIRHLVHSLENAILNLPPDQEQMVWLIDFKGWTLRKALSLNTTREVAYVLQNMYPERLRIAILFNPPLIFETFWTMVKPFLDTKTFNKVKFVHTKNKESMKFVQEYFDLDVLEVPLGGRRNHVYNNADYTKQMKIDDAKTAKFWGFEKEKSTKEKAVKKIPKTAVVTPKVDSALVTPPMVDTAVTA